jgi:hypothetical protein
MGIVVECDIDVRPILEFVALFMKTPSTYNDTVPVDDVYVPAKWCQTPSLYFVGDESTYKPVFEEPDVTPNETEPLSAGVKVPIILAEN